jgi:GcrA cell cycle regulator
MSKLWTLEREVLLRTLHGIGWTSTEMAQEMGLTRSAVVGKCKRLGLRLVRPPAVKHVKPQEPLQPAQDDLPGVAVLEARGEHCRWPISADGAPYRFCGAPRVFPHSWCAEHGRRAYRVPPIEFSHVSGVTQGPEANEPAPISHPSAPSEPNFTSHPKPLSEPIGRSHPQPQSEPEDVSWT